jgi:hypothetical protein
MASNWFEVVSGTSLEQGDIVSNCPVYSVIYPSDPEKEVSDIDKTTYELIILSQSCDLVEGRENVSSVVLCSIASMEQINRMEKHALKRKGRLEQAAKNKEPAFFVLDRFEHPTLGRDISVVHFRNVYTLPIPFLRQLASNGSERLRLRTPYREALAHQFAAFFGRIALPQAVTI